MAQSMTIRLPNGSRKTYPSIAEAAQAADMSVYTLWMRLQNGWSPTRAFTTPVRSYNKRKGRAKR